MTKESDILAEALAAHDAAALAQFERDGRRDCGSCGGYMLGYRANTRFAKAMVTAGVGWSTDGKTYLSRRLPDGIASQHMEIPVQACRAFRAVTEAAGIMPTEARSYVD